MNNLYKVRTITCVSCGKIVTKRMPEGRRYCSLECYRRSEHPQRNNGANVNCEVCGKEFYLPKNRIEASQYHFCCKEHFDTWFGRNKTTHICKICGNEFKWSPSRSKSYNITYCSLACRDADPINHERLIKMNIRQQQLHPNSLERLGYALLDSIGLNYIPQHLIADKFCVDAFAPDTKTVIQFDGDYWHGNLSVFSLLNFRQSRRRKLDSSQDAYLHKCGYTVIRIWESELKKNPDAVKAKLLPLVTPR